MQTGDDIAEMLFGGRGSCSRVGKEERFSMVGIWAYLGGTVWVTWEICLSCGGRKEVVVGGDVGFVLFSARGSTKCALNLNNSTG